MKKIIFLILLLSTSLSYTYAQTIGTGYKIRFLKNVNPQPQFGENSYSALWGYTAPNGREYALLGCYGGTSIIDITDTNNIHEVDFVPCPNIGEFGNSWREIKTYSHYAYVVSEANNSNLQIIDLQYLPDSARYLGNSSPIGGFNTHSIAQSGPYLYLNGGTFSGFKILDLSVNPEAPTYRGIWNLDYVHDLRIVNDTAWTCNIYDGKVTIVNVTNKNTPTTVTSWINNPQPNSPHNIALSNDRRYAYVTDETFSPSAGRMKIWNVSNINNPVYITSFNPTPFELADAHNVELHNNYAFLAYYTAGVKVLDLSNPSNPVELGWYDTYPENNGSHYDGCWGIYYFPASNKIIGSDQKRGLFVLRPDLSAPVSAMPKANFEPSELEVINGDSTRMIDASLNIPTSWQWTITGPETKTSNLKFPKFAFHTTGLYTVKLRVSNSFGSDSITKTDAFRVKSAPLGNFTITSPLGTPFYRITTTQSDTGKVNFRWSKSSIDARYKLYFKKSSGPQERYLSPGNNGLDSFFVMRKSYMDSMAVQFGLTADSVLITFRVRSYNETDSMTSTNNTPIIIKTTTVGIENISDIIPDKYNLYQNYPNPFNPTTNIKFDLPKNGYVNLILYDVTGKEILKLVDQSMQAGAYNYQFNASNLNSGIYFIRLITNDFSQTRKIVLVK